MFRKRGLSVQSSNPLRSSERRKIRDELSASLPELAEAVHEAITSKDHDLVMLRLSNRSVVYCVDSEVGRTKRGTAERYGQPMLFTAPPHDGLFPSVYALWLAAPRVVMPSVFVHAPVAAFVLNGADVMMPGVCRVRGGGYGGLRRGEPRCATAVENPWPFAVGVCAVDERDVLAPAHRRGKGLMVLHSVGDWLWTLGNRSLPNEGFTTAEVRAFGGGGGGGSGGDDAELDSDERSSDEESAVAATDGGIPSDDHGGDEAARADHKSHEAHDVGGSDGHAVDAVVGEGGLPAVTADEVEADFDGALLRSFCTLVARVLTSDERLPMDSTRVLEELSRIAPALQPSAKRLHVFLRSASKRQICKVKDLRDQLQLTAVNRRHPEVLSVSSEAIGVPRRAKEDDDDGGDGEGDDDDNDDHNDGGGDEGEGGGAKDADGSETDGESVDVELMDEALEQSLLQAMKFTLPAEQDADRLPMEASAFFTSVLVPSAPEHVSLDVRSSSYKKLGAFLRSMQKRKLCRIKELRGQLQVLSLNREHADCVNFRPLAATRGSAAPEGGARAGGAAAAAHTGIPSAPRMELLYRPQQHQRHIFEAMNADSRTYYTKREAMNILESYIQMENLILEDDRDRRKRVVRMDVRLEDALVKGERKKLAAAGGGAASAADSLPSSGDHLQFDELSRRFAERLQIYHAVHTASGAPPVVRPGAIPHVMIHVQRRQGRKHVTVVCGLEAFGLDVEQVAQRFQHVFACAVTTNVVTRKGREEKELQMQGNNAKRLRELLSKEYGIAMQNVDVHQPAATKKKAG